MTQTEALKLALEALELCNGSATVEGVVIYTDLEIATIKEALAQHDKEPVAWVTKRNVIVDGLWEEEITFSEFDDGGDPVYYTPPQRTEERNFCPRCGKRTADLTVIHTCTPPQPEQEPVAWKLMPRDATDSMLKAMDECSTEGYDERLYAGHAASVYMAAWDEAPTLAQPEQEPVAYLCENAIGHKYFRWKKPSSTYKPIALYTTPPQQEPVAMKFKIYKPTVPDPMRQGINNALLPWVYDQDRSSGFDASMWVTPVATLPPQRKPWVGLTDEEHITLHDKFVDTDCYGLLIDAVEAKLKEKNT